MVQGLLGQVRSVASTPSEVGTIEGSGSPSGSDLTWVLKGFLWTVGK